MANRLWGVALLASVCVACGNDARDESDNRTLGQVAQAQEISEGAATPAPLSLSFPGGVRAEELALGASEALRIGDRARVEDAAERPAPVANAGAGRVELGADSVVGAVTSVGDVFLRERASVTGDVQTSGTLERQAATRISGNIVENAELTPLTELRFAAAFPTSNDGAVEVAPGQDRALAPGAFSRVTVQANGSLLLSSGTYFFDSLQVEPGAELVLDGESGLVSVVVRDQVTFRGSSRALSGELPNWVLLASGAGSSFLEGSFSGSAFAPNGTLVLGAQPGDTYAGSFFGREIELRPGARVTHRAFAGFPEFCAAFSGEGAACGASSAEPAAGGTAVDLSFPLPDGVDPNDVGPAGGASVSVGSGVEVGPGCDATRTPILASAGGDTTVGENSSLGAVVTRGSLRLGSGARVSGDVTASGEVQGGAIGGAQRANASVGFGRALSLRVIFPGDPVSDLVLEAGRARILYPEVYGDVVLRAGSKLYLRSGQYFFDNFTAEPGSEVIVESSGGLLSLNVEQSLSWGAAVSGLGGVEPELFVAYAGQSPAELQGSFIGTLFAPRAELSVENASVRGQLFARFLRLADGVRLEACAAPWDFLLGEAPVTRSVALPPSPVLISATAGAPGTANPDSPVSFQLPDTLPATGGNAGNGTATLSYEQAGSLVTCTYRGGASVAHPETLLELARGREYLFESCDNGARALDTQTGSSFGLDVTGDPDSTGPGVGVTLALGGGCDGLLKAPITPAQSVQMLQSFDWGAAPALPETTATGEPTLFYANIYIRDETERELLDRFLIHYSTKPIFDDELEALYGGKCGTIDTSGDGNGLFVFAILPGRTYNRIRAAVSSPDVEPSERVLFQAIVLREAPPALTAADGSLRYDLLREAGFQYLNVRELPDDAALDFTALPGGGAAAFVSAIDFVVTVARDTVRLVVDILGEIDRFLQGEVTVGLDLNLQNRDDRFPGVMTRGWGPGAGQEMGLRGVRIEIRQWAQRIYSLGVPLPTSFHGYANDAGAVRLRVAAGGGGFGGATSVRGESGFCVDLENNSGEITHFLTPSVICDFSALDVEAIGARGETRSGTSVFENFERDTHVEVETANFEMTVLNEATDSFDYTRDVVGRRMRPARMLSGIHASVLSAGGEVLWAPCFGSGSTVVDAATLLALGVPIVGPALSFYLAVVGSSDIVVPKGSLAETTRGKITHEYGHYITCNLVEANDENLLTFTTLTLETIAGGQGNPAADEEPRIVNEALADFFTGQIAGGADYVNLLDASGGQISFCNNTGDQCWDGNLRLENQGDERIGRLATLMHDGFDGHRKLTLAPSNGDAWDQSGADLVFIPAPYGDAADESVLLGGPSIDAFINRFLDNRNLLGAFRVRALEAGLGQTVLESHSWCQACEMFLPHHLSTAGMSQQDIWQSCAAEERIRGAIGAPPDADLRLSASTCELCPAGSRSDAAGSCVACLPNEALVGNTCSACAPGSVPSGDACVPCGQNEISAGNVCVACPFGQGADTASNTCVECPADASIDWATRTDPACGFAEVSATSPAGDVCPEELWVDVINLNGTSPGGRTSDFSIEASLQNDIREPAVCQQTAVDLTLAERQAGGLVSLDQVSSTDPAVCVPPPPSDEIVLGCLDGTCLHAAELTLPSAQVAAGTTEVRLVASARGAGGALPASVSVQTTNCLVPVPR